MPQLRRRIKTADPGTPFEKNLESELLSAWAELAGLLNKGLRFEDNFDAYIATVADSGTANTSFTVAHTLKRVPTGFVVLNADRATQTYDAGTAWTATGIYLKTSAANCVLKILVF